MYAYKQVSEKTSLHAVPNYRNITRPTLQKEKINKKNKLFELYRFLVCFLFLLAFATIVFPKTYNTLIKQVFYPTTYKIHTHYKNGMLNNGKINNSSINLYKIYSPTVNYLYNDIFNNQVLLTPSDVKKHNEITSLFSTTEMTKLKSQLLNLGKSYPSIKPAVYVMEYDSGNYVDINGDTQYPAASIIKLPVLVRMFKSIEANQFTIYDEMKMLPEYVSSGSGNLQYSQTGKNYSMDYLAKTMIQDSDNTSTNMIISKLGGMSDVNVGLRDWNMPKTYVRTWLPDLDGTNKTTAKEMATLLYNLDNPGFLNINSREYIIDYMSHVKNNRLIQAGLGEGALFVHKTGDIGTMLGDAGIVYAPNGKKYIVVILALRPYNSPLGKEYIVNASRLIYKYIVG
ncbi:MAG: class A beta-lactamase-related serine hydrolase [bacterium]|nr:class A beta-lactamase-related serine hydrolase [bacterium]